MEETAELAQVVRYCKIEIIEITHTEELTLQAEQHPNECPLQELFLQQEATVHRLVHQVAAVVAVEAAVAVAVEAEVAAAGEDN